MKPAIVLDGLSDAMLFGLSQWLIDDYTPPFLDIVSVELLGRSIGEEAKRRGWPKAWMDDPASIPGLDEWRRGGTGVASKAFDFEAREG